MKLKGIFALLAVIFFSKHRIRKVHFAAIAEDDSFHLIFVNTKNQAAAKPFHHVFNFIIPYLAHFTNNNFTIVLYDLVAKLVLCHKNVRHKQNKYN